jgi:predicted enzyme related to lactoylglutathione lyase
MPRVVHFEIHADDVQRAVKFYGDLFGWKIESWDGPVEYWLVTTGEDQEPGINGAIMKRPEPAATSINYVDVPSVDEFVRKAEALAGVFGCPRWRFRARVTPPSAGTARGTPSACFRMTQRPDSAGSLRQAALSKSH